MPLAPEMLRSATDLRGAIVRGDVSRRALRDAVDAVPWLDRDAWLDAVLGLGELPEDGAELPRGCTPYVPCSVDAILALVDLAELGPSDVLVDVGSGLGRAAITAHLLSGAHVVGIEIQSHLVEGARALAASLGVARCELVHGDAAARAADLARGSAFFLYCPFGGERVERVLDAIAPSARTRRVRICSVDLPLPRRDWLARAGGAPGGIELYESTSPRAR